MSVRCQLGFHAFERTYESRTYDSDFYDFGRSVRWDTRKQDEMRCSRCGLTEWWTIDHERNSSNTSHDMRWVRDRIAALKEQS